MSDIAASQPIAEMLLSAEENWLQRIKDPSAPLLSSNQCYDGGLHDLSTPLKNLWVNSFSFCSFIVSGISFVCFLCKNLFLTLFTL